MDFYKLSIRVSHVEEDVENGARYINGFRYEIQDEISILSLVEVEDTYQTTLKSKEKMARKKYSKE